jgi:hypothetical protein
MIFPWKRTRKIKNRLAVKIFPILVLSRVHFDQSSLDFLPFIK